MPDLARAHADLLASLASAKPPRIALRPSAEDFSACARHIESVIGACKTYFIALIGYADENEEGSCIAEADLIGAIEAHLSDLAGETAGVLEQLADRISNEGPARNVSHSSRY